MTRCRSACSSIGSERSIAIVGYQWHPFDSGFYVQPWLALGVVAWRSGEAIVGTHAYDEMPVSVFFTANLGYEHRF